MTTPTADRETSFPDTSVAGTLDAGTLRPGRTLRTRCLVVGDGPAGMVAALALAACGVEVALAGMRLSTGAPVTNAPTATAGASLDTRTAALFPASLALLDRIGAGPARGLQATLLLGIRIIDDSGGILRAPEVLFRPDEIGEASFGSNASQAEIGRALTTALGLSSVRRLDGGAVAELELGPEAAIATLADGSRIEAELVVAADGRASVCRAAAGIGVRRWSYNQAAVATSFSHGRPHRGISTELHRPAGPCTTVPLGGNASSLVWVERPAEAYRLQDVEPAAFLAALERTLGGLLGSLSELGARRAFAIEGLTATALTGQRLVLVGEAAHVIPPIGAQGLNLGLMDVAVLADCVADALAGGRDIGGPQVLQNYGGARAAEIDKRARAVDLMNRSLTSDILPLTLARGLGLHVLAGVPALRRQVMRQGLAPSGPLPRLMRPLQQGQA